MPGETNESDDAVSGIGRRRSAAKVDGSASYQKRREEIAEAAVKVFDRLGFKGASISAVAAELGIDRASIYYYISSKEELFDVVMRAVIERNAEIALKIVGSVDEPKRKLRDLIIALMNSYGDSYPLIYIYIREDLSQVSDRRSEWSATMRRLNREIENAIITIIEQGYANGSFRRVGNARVVAYGILGVLGWTHRWFRPGKSDIGTAEIGLTYADMMLSGLETHA